MVLWRVILGLAIAAPAWLGSGCGPEPSALAQAPTPSSLTPPTLSKVQTPRSNVEPDPSATKEQAPQGWQPRVPLREWEFIVLHHTATAEGDVPTINKEHQKRKDSGGAAWRGIGYHFLIGNGKGMKDGEIEPTFRWIEQADGAHAGSLPHNERGIGICLVGNFNKTVPTKKQLASLKKLMAWLKTETDIPDERILKHSDIKSTACPGKKFPQPR